MMTRYTTYHVYLSELPVRSTPGGQDIAPAYRARASKTFCGRHAGHASSDHYQ